MGKDVSGDSSLKNIGCAMMYILFQATIGAWSVNTVALYFTDQAVPWLAAALIGLLVGPVTVPVAILLVLLG